MQIDRRWVGFGLFLVTVGAVMIGVRQGWVDPEIAGRAWTLWPLLLIGAGLSILLTRGAGAAVGGLVVAVTLGAIVGGIAATGSFGSGLCAGDANDGQSFPETSGTLDRGSVSLVQSCGDLTIGTVAGTTWSLGGVSSDGRAPRVESASDRLRIESDRDEGFDLDGSTSWELVLPRDPTVSLDLEANAGAGRIALGGAHLTSLSIKRNAGSVDLDLREVAALDSFELEVNAGSATLRLPNLSVSGSLQVNAGSIAICRPEGVGLRITLEDSVAASNDFANHGLTERNGVWESAGYATAPLRIAIEAQANAGSLPLDPAGPCAG